VSTNIEALWRSKGSIIRRGAHGGSGISGLNLNVHTVEEIEGAGEREVQWCPVSSEGEKEERKNPMNDFAHTKGSCNQSMRRKKIGYAECARDGGRTYQKGFRA